MSEPTIADEMKDQWHKVVGALLGKFGDQQLTIEDFAGIDGKVVVVSHRDEGHVMTLRLVTPAEAYRLTEAFRDATRRKN